MLSMFKKKCPVCRMKKEEGKGIGKYGKWFCSENCLEKFESNIKNSGGCCGGH